MPSDDSLQSRGYNMVSMCSLCSKQAETSSHLFFTCPLATQIWNWIKGIFNIHLDLSSVKAILLASKADWCDQVHHLFTACIIHAISTIWWCRNQCRFHNKDYSIGSVINRIITTTSLSASYSKISSKPSLIDLCIRKAFKVSINYPKAPSILEVIWQPPTRNTIKVNTDGATIGYPGHAGGGAIFRDHSGQCIACMADYYGIEDALFAEFNAALSAILFAISKGWMNLWLECDSTLVVEILNGNHNPPWKLINKWIQCKAKMVGMNFRVSHIYREGNSCADKLANYGINSKVSSKWMSTPNFIHHEFLRNRNLLPSYRFSSSYH
ncbi:PREDICTED: uncharacterized protein LOC109359893 [Lupinus angustifolius]|uniref:uncharacterized protein LOC109359893 n=1 Tax=Lupinus angustifolius TaxID=3871 RepID=UPI00092FA6C9|nr:PREDICTED: uncharacterized protein LOC109359893 [Lupinus angustifolius]